MKKVLILAFLLSGCASMQQAIDAYGSTAIHSAQHANDSYALAWAAAACGTTVGAAMRNPQLIPALRLLCAPASGMEPAALLDPIARAGRE